MMNQATIMIVDDTPANLRFLEHVLLNAGYRAAVFPRGDLALAAARKQKPDLILLDIMMPGMDGFEVCRRLKNDDALKDVPVLFLSALSQPEIVVKSFQEGGVDYITKPFNEKEVLARIRTHLTIVNQRRQIEEQSKKLEEAYQAKAKVMQEQLMLLTSALESSRDAVIITDTDGRIQQANRALSEITGYTRKDLKSMSLAELWSGEPNDGCEFGTIWNEILNGNTYRTERLCRRKDGASFWADCFLMPVRISKDQIGNVIVVVRDVTRMKEAEKRLRENEARLREAQQIARLGYWEYDIVNDVLTWSDIVFDIFEVNKEDFTGNSDFLFRRVHPEDRERVKKTYRQSVQEHSRYSCVYRIVTPDGAVKYVHDRAKTYYGEDGAPLRTMGTIQDITELKRTEEELRKVQQRFINLVERVRDVVWTTRLDGSGMEVNNAVEHIYGISKEEFQNNPVKWRELVHPDDRAIAEESRKKLMQDGYAETEYRIVRPDGEIRWIRDRKSVLFDDQGNPVEMGGIASDITEIKKKEEERMQIERQLIQAQKMEAMGRLAGGIAHDFNNMLSVILGYSENLLDELDPDDPLRDDVKQIVYAGKRSAALTRQILAFSRKQTIQPEIVDLNEVLRNLEKMLRRLIGEDIVLELSLSRDLSRVKVDPGQIEQVVMNLAVNARDAMLTGGRLLIETSEVELDEAYARHHPDVEPGKYVMLAVTDTGSGMDEETLSKIFEPFFTTKENGKGTGLGLSTVYGIVKQSGGHIRAFSEPGQSTTFRIYLPVVGEQAEARAEEAAEDKPAGGDEHILVVEDDESVRKLMEKGLVRLGYRVTVAANGREALFLVEEKGLRPDLVVTDVVMPGMSGSVLAERLREKHPDLKILFVSGYTDNAIVHHGVLAPGTSFMQKPFLFQDLAKKIRAVLRGE